MRFSWLTLVLVLALTVPAFAQDPAEGGMEGEAPATDEAPAEDEAVEEEAVEEESGEEEPAGDAVGAEVSRIMAGYEKSGYNGVFLRSEDGQLEFRIGAYTQLRFDINHRDAPAGEDDVEQGFSVNRTRLFFTGQYTEWYGFHFRINYNDSFDPELLVALAQLKIDDNSHVRLGKQFLALSREDWQFAQDVLTTEFSPNDFTFAIGTSIGAQYFRSFEDSRFWVGLSNGAYGGKDEFPKTNAADIALNGRYELALSGDDWSVWDDLVGRPGRADGSMLGVGFLYQYRSNDPLLVENAMQLNVDYSMNGDGWQGMVAVSMTWLDDDINGSDSVWGLMAQLGYFIADAHQVYGQFNHVNPGTMDQFNSFSSLCVGVNWFPMIWTNRWKFSLEGGILMSALNDTIVAESGSLGWLSSDEKGQMYLRLQLQMGF
ncbi:MAG: porin [Planctomycetota bacterium]